MTKPKIQRGLPDVLVISFTALNPIVTFFWGLWLLGQSLTTQSITLFALTVLLFALGIHGYRAGMALENRQTWSPRSCRTYALLSIIWYQLALLAFGLWSNSEPLFVMMIVWHVGCLLYIALSRELRHLAYREPIWAEVVDDAPSRRTTPQLQETLPAASLGGLSREKLKKLYADRPDRVLSHLDSMLHYAMHIPPDDELRESADWTLFLIGDICLDLQLFQRAVTAFEAAFDREFSRFYCLLNIGLAHQKLSQHEDALEALEAAEYHSEGIPEWAQTLRLQMLKTSKLATSTK